MRNSTFAKLPYRTYNSAGYDLSSVCQVTIPPHDTMKIKTGIHIIIPSGHYGRIGMLPYLIQFCD